MKNKSVAATKTLPDKPELLLECPKDLSPKAREEWDRILSELPQIIEIKNIDRTMLTLFCEAFAQWCEAMVVIRKFGPVMKSPSGYLIQSPYVAVANQAAGVMERIGADFGLSPGTRSKLPRLRSKDPGDWELPSL